MCPDSDWGFHIAKSFIKSQKKPLVMTTIEKRPSSNLNTLTFNQNENNETWKTEETRTVLYILVCLCDLLHYAKAQYVMTHTFEVCTFYFKVSCETFFRQFVVSREVFPA